MIEEINTDSMVRDISNLIKDSRKKIAYQINKTLLTTYWNVGRIIVEHEQEGDIKAQYGRQVLIKLSKELTRMIGKGFSVSNLELMRRFYIDYQKSQTLSGKLSWSHYCELLGISDSDKRSFYEKECISSNWSVRELKKQIQSSLFERLLLSDGKINKQKVIKLAREGQTLINPEDIIKDPYVFEFLGFKEQKPLFEKNLEKKLIQHMEDFLLELGKGFMFVGSQQRITLNNTHYYVDMVFYNKILKAYVLIDLKIGKMKPEYVGQMNMYVNYYDAEVNDIDDNKPIGIILCTDNKNASVQYAIGGLTNHIFTSTYTYYMPDKEQLMREIETVLSDQGK